MNDLNPMQRLCADAIADGVATTNKELARHLGRSEDSVQGYVCAILETWNLAKRSEICARVFTERRGRGNAEEPKPDLFSSVSPQRLWILDLFERGVTTDEGIAKARGLKLNTAKSEVRKFLRELNLGNRNKVIREITQRHYALPPEERPRRLSAPAASQATRLTPTEARYADAIGDGLIRSAELADYFGVSKETVHDHVSSIMGKLGFQSRLEIGIHALSHRKAFSWVELVINRQPLLTSDEKDVDALLKKGICEDQGVAAELQISKTAARSRVDRLVEKYGAGTRGRLVIHLARERFRQQPVSSARNGNGARPVGNGGSQPCACRL